MTYPDLPAEVKSMLASEGHRTHHHIWHFVRSKGSWDALPAASRDQLSVQGWAAPRFNEEPGSGIDFLGMHRQMIEMTNEALANAAQPDWLRVTGWDPIPWEEDNADWPVPDWNMAPPTWASEELWQSFTESAERARSQGRIQEMRQVAAAFLDPERFKSMTLDELGIAMEWSVHGWMHMRWSGAPHSDSFSTSPDNDWLFVPWSSHVNKVFWKLHGWIDKRIDDWAAATGQVVDLSNAWVGPNMPHHGMPHMASPALLSFLPSRESQPMPMGIRQHIVEGLLN